MDDPRFALSETAGSRSADDKLSRVIRVSIGGQSYELPVRSIAANREWKARLAAEQVGAFQQLGRAGNDLPQVLAALTDKADVLIDVLLSYDTGGVLPTKEQIEAIEPDCTLDIIAAVREVWRAANPLVVMSLAALAATPPSPTTSSAPPSTAGRRGRSKAN